MAIYYRPNQTYATNCPMHSLWRSENLARVETMLLTKHALLLSSAHPYNVDCARARVLVRTEDAVISVSPQFEFGVPPNQIGYDLFQDWVKHGLKDERRLPCFTGKVSI